MIYKNKKMIFLFLFPAMMYISLFLLYPFLRNIFNSFFEITAWGSMGRFVGWDNYKTMLSDPFPLNSPLFWEALRNTLVLMLWTLVFQVGLGLILALLVESIGFGKKFFQTVYFFPIVISATALGLLCKLIFDFNGGMLNQVLESLGRDPVLWLGTKHALKMISVPIIWQYVGFYFVIIFTGIQRIPNSLYESAELEGVTGFKKAIYITIPLIWDMIQVCIVLAITGTIKVFDLVWIISGGREGTEVLGTYMYKQTFEAAKIGYGSAIAVMIVIVGIVISLTVNKLLSRESITY